MKMIRIAAQIPEGRNVDRTSRWIHNVRLTDTQSVSRTTGVRANKEYNIRVYTYPDGRFGVIAFYGPIGGTMQRDWKGEYATRESAINQVRNIVSEKINNPRSNYETNRERPINENIPGVQQLTEPRPPRVQQQNARPQPQQAPQQIVAQPPTKVYEINRENWREINQDLIRNNQVSVSFLNEDGVKVTNAYGITKNRVTDGWSIHLGDSYGVGHNLGSFPTKEAAIARVLKLMENTIEQNENKVVAPQEVVNQDTIDKIPYASDELENLMGNKNIRLLKTAQIRPGQYTQRDLQHGSYDMYRQMLESGNPTPAGISIDRSFTYRVTQNRDGDWVAYKGDGIMEGPMIVLQTFDSKNEAIDFIIADTHAEEDRYAREKQAEAEVARIQKKEKEKKEEPKEDDLNVIKEVEELPFEPEEPAPFADDALENIMGKVNNWYKVAKKSEKTIRRTSR